MPPSRKAIDILAGLDRLRLTTLTEPTMSNATIKQSKLIDPYDGKRLPPHRAGLKVPSLVDKQALFQIKRAGGRWAAYQNHDLGSRAIGHVKFLQFGGHYNTFKSAEELPAHYPADSISQGHNYLLVGEIDFATVENGISSGIKPIE